MPDDTPEIAALKAAKAKAELERDIAKAALEKQQAELSVVTATAEAAAKEAKSKAEAEAAAAKARAELERDVAKAAAEKRQSDLSQATAEAEAAAKAAKAALEKQQSELAQSTGRAEAAAKEAKAKADAEAAAATAEAAVLKARIGTVEGSGLSGSVTAESGAAAAEAGLLAAWAVDAAAERIAAEIKARVEAQGQSLATTHFILFAGAGRPRLADWQMFEARRASVAAGFAAIERDLSLPEGDVGDALRALMRPRAAGEGAVIPGVMKSFGLAGALPAVGAAIDAASKLGSFFQSEFKVAPIAVVGADDDLLALSLAGRLPQASYPARAPAGAEMAADEAIEDLLGDLVKDEARARDHLATAKAKRLAAEAAAAAAEDKDEKAKLTKTAADQAAMEARLAAALKAFDALADSLAGTDQAGVPLIARVLEQKMLARRLRGGALALSVQVTGAAGTTYTKKNLWTFLGTLPFFVSGGAVARYAAVTDTGIVRAAGQVPVHSGYHPVHAVAEKFRRRF